ncbi:pancreatic progenitor cell differentiation and proliferation factor isoform X2 [Cygnus atratus]|uniref:pancreatic progenitor cell differentiation and proliferation factor isoform X2 n=1 Tax=Cygnus atratus TaxID=8868 RepID=UPI0021B81ACC|nr:pancreatic progenitor cell differentiation and proliferation factor isoform X2 [Cygnus atratus]
MASIPSSGSLMATHNYRRRRLSSTSSNSSCSSSDYGEVIPHHPAWERCRCRQGSWHVRWCQQWEQDGGGTPASPASDPRPERAGRHSPSRSRAAQR